VPNAGYCVNYPSNIFSRNTRGFENYSWGISQISIYTLGELGVLSNLIGSLSLANEHYSPPTE